MENRADTTEAKMKYPGAEVASAVLRQYEVETFLILDECGNNRNVQDRKAMQGTKIQAFYYLITALVFVIYGTVFCRNIL